MKLTQKHSTIYVLIFLFIVTTNSLIAQAPTIKWAKCFGGSLIDAATTILQLQDGGFIFAVNSESSDGDFFPTYGLQDAYVIKTDSLGNIKWKKRFGGTQSDVIKKIIRTKDGGFILCGSTESNDYDITNAKGGLDFWLLKLDSSGNKQWSKAYGGLGGESAQSIAETFDGGYVVIGSTIYYHPNYPNVSNDIDVSVRHGYYNNIWVLKVDSSGSKTWENTFGTSSDNWGFDILQTKDSGYVLIGEVEFSGWDVSFSHGFSDFWVAKLKPNGKIQWEKSYGTKYDDRARQIKATQDGGFLISGYVKTGGGDVTNFYGGDDFWIFKIDSIGNLLWNQTYGGTKQEILYKLELTNDGGCILAGLTNSSDVFVNGQKGQQNCWLVKLSSKGKLQWQKCLGGSTADAAFDIIQNSDSGYTLCGYVTSNDKDVTCSPAYFCDAWVVRLFPASFVDADITIATNNSIICNNQKAVFKATIKNGGASPKYVWKVNGVTVGGNVDSFSTNILKNNDTINCVLISNAGNVYDTIVESNKIIVKVKNDVSPNISISITDTSICKNSFVTIKSSIAYGGSSPAYNWFKNSSQIANTSDSLLLNQLQNGDTVFCKLTSNEVCASPREVLSNKLVFTVTNPIKIIVNPISYLQCVGTSLIINPTTINETPTTQFSWSKNGITVGINSKQLSLSSITQNDTGIYQLAANNGVCGNSTSDLVSIKINPTTVTNITDTICEGNKYFFNNSYYTKAGIYKQGLLNVFGCDSTVILDLNVKANNISVQKELKVFVFEKESIILSPHIIADTPFLKLKINWQPKTFLLNPTLWQPLCKPENDINYILSLTDGICRDTGLVVVKVSPLINIPNVFSPNNDNVNDYWVIKNLNLFTGTTVVVFNRYGQKVFSSIGYNRPWDGTYMNTGKPLPFGSYFYIIKINGDLSKDFTGTVTILR